MSTFLLKTEVNQLLDMQGYPQGRDWKAKLKLFKDSIFKIPTRTTVNAPNVSLDKSFNFCH